MNVKTTVTPQDVKSNPFLKLPKMQNGFAQKNYFSFKHLVY